MPRPKQAKSPGQKRPSNCDRCAAPPGRISGRCHCTPKSPVAPDRAADQPRQRPALPLASWGAT
eukprot:571325-Alexandrium_andersonii.AAC.1